MSRLSFQKLQEDLKEVIASLPAESRLPSEPNLAKQMGVSRATLREAMRSFETEGLIRRQQGVGTFHVGETLIRISRVILTDDRPVAYLVDTIPSSLISRAELENELSSSVLDYLLQKG